MGSGTYSYRLASSRAEVRRTKDIDEIFTSESKHTHKVTQKYDINGKIREAKDSEEHPNSFPIIIALDVTGSMGSIPERLIKHDFPEIMKKVMDAGIDDPQICFLGIGDHECDDVPLQVSQFESSDDLIDTWLEGIYIESGGGSNYGESYPLAWYFAAYHTDIDSFNKRGKKGVLITIGDEPFLRDLPKETLNNLFGEGQSDLKAKDVYKTACDKWDIYHIHMAHYDNADWKKLLKQHLITVNRNESIINTISDININSFNNSPTSEVSQDTESPSSDIEIL